MSTHTNPTETHGTQDIQAERREMAAVLARRTPIWKPVVFLAGLVVVAGALVALGAVPRAAQRRDIVETNEAIRALGKRVTYVAAVLATPTRTLTLPASLRPNADADLRAQATGFVRERKVDIGDAVAAGDVLAVLDVPLVDEQWNSAKAALTEAEAAREVLSRNLDLARTTLERWQSVETPGAVSKQEIDERSSAYESARASLAAGEAAISSRKADVQRFESNRDFARIVAPFAGTITARNVELGDYVNGAGSGEPLFRIADTRTLRAYVDVPQTFAPGVVVGGAARITLRERPGLVVQGIIARTSGALDERTRTLRVEISVPNEANVLLAGSYAQVEMDLVRDTSTILVPGSALLVRAEGTRVAVIDAANTLHYRTVRIGRDLGSQVEIIDGVAAGENVVVNMADELPDGSQVEGVALPPVVAPKPMEAKPAEPKSGDVKPVTPAATKGTAGR